MLPILRARMRSNIQPCKPHTLALLIPGARCILRNDRSLHLRSPTGIPHGYANHRHPSNRIFGIDQRRTFLTAATQSLPPWLLPPAVFVGLFLTLWIYKCIMLVVFQEKIIYMPYVPPFARSESVEDYLQACGGVRWREVELRASDGVGLRACVGGIEAGNASSENRRTGELDGRRGEKRRRVVICHFHGNGGSLPPRLPMLSNVLKAVHTRQEAISTEDDVEFVLVALSYRGYWTSSGRPSQAGVEKDAHALLGWVNETYVGLDDPFSKDTKLILWGQSLGAGVATTAGATYASLTTPGLPIAGLVLETPFTSIESMLLALYPQTWLPYRYLGMFLRSHWDSEKALRNLAAWTASGTVRASQPRVLIFPAAKDEVVPAGEAEKLEVVCEAVGLRVERKEVSGALHNDATTKSEGRAAVAGWIVQVASEANSQETPKEG